MQYFSKQEAQESLVDIVNELQENPDNVYVVTSPEDGSPEAVIVSVELFNKLKAVK